MKTLLKYAFVLATVVASTLTANEPYDSIRTVALEPFFIEDGFILLDKVNNQGTTVFVDVGSINGAASRYIAATTNDTVKVYTINPWNSDYSFQKFLSNVKQENQNEKITAIRMNSGEASAALNLVSEFIFIDASDSDTIYENILSWVSHLSEHGIISGNHWERTSVDLAVVKAAADLNLSLSTNGTYWFLKKI